ncbi:MAG: ribonuclease D [Nitrospira sp.]|nr:ribonuclease D [Nitrospira sp.]
MTTFPYIATAKALRELCERLQDSPRMALDTEFVGEDSFVPKLELIQVATDDMAAVIDFPAVQHGHALDLFWEILCNPAIQKVVHAGRQDLDLFAIHAGRIPKPFFDTQIAAAMVGYGAQVAYASLVQRVHGAKLEKAHTFTNWSARPLSQEQLAYALDDVTYLLAIYDHLYARLSQAGRLEWAVEEFSRLEAVVGEMRRHSQDRYQRVKGWDTLKPKSAAVLRALTAWREDEAKRRNSPRGRVIRDEVLLQLARHPPRTLQALRTIRGLHESEITRSGEALLNVISAALALPPSEWPQVPRERKPEPESAGLVELLQAVLKARAAQQDIAPALLGTTADLQALAAAKAKCAAGHCLSIDLPLLKGWRKEMVGDLLLDVLDGRLAVRVDPLTGVVSWTSVAGERNN